ncbi:hypothetical protein DT019_36580 [Streptomyces sp. SDr-06]|uniref:hypothetical protein n=1 Tax=Streptomyces sp. SDr-06 TaxID=2267702 RepID=UPI000DEA05E6|nr:hypothetical protein [Streptomyces sp. SDr-06]RCH61749.1 hypothetical protein DT019_36580 [Streptomyces sp. SDr-06]
MMIDSRQYREELDYFVDYAGQTTVYLPLLYDAAEGILDSKPSREEVERVILQLISDVIDRGVQVVDLGGSGGDFTPWESSKSETLRRVAEEMKRYDDPMDFIEICWFRA